MESRTSGAIKIVTINPEDLRLEVDLLDRGATRPETGQQVIDRLHPDALICGPMFEIPSGQGYGAYTVARLIYRYLDARSNVNVQSAYPQRGGTISVVDNQAVFKRGDQIQEGSQFAIQGYPSLVENGSNVASATNDTQAEGRCAIGIQTDGKVVFCLGTLGMREFAAAMIRAGIKWAVYLDGGGSSTLYSDTFHIGLTSRRLPAYIMAMRSASEAVIDGLNHPIDTMSHPVQTIGTISRSATSKPTMIVIPVLALGFMAWYLSGDH